MSILTAIFIFILVWWLVIFIALPWGNAAHERPQIGHAASAPANPRLKQKMLWTTVISFVITLGIVLTVHYTGFTLHGWLKSWAATHQSL